MPSYRVSVTEVRHVPCTYVVEAETPEGAISKARRGDTVSEVEDGRGEVNDRDVLELPSELVPIREGKRKKKGATDGG